MTGMRDEREARARFLLGRLLADMYQDQCAAALLRGAVNYMPDLVAAHVDLGVVYCRLEKYREMVRSFRRAIDVDAEAVRSAVRDEPEELEHLRRALYLDQPGAKPTEPAGELKAPRHVRESWALVRLGREHVAAGRDREAAAELESALKLDGMSPPAVALLALTHLLMRADGRSVSTAAVLSKLKPRLAKLIFEA